MVQLGSEFWAAILGAITGGLITAGLQWLSFKNQKQQRDQEQNDRNTMVGHALVFKVMRIHTNLFWLNNYMNETFKIVENEKSNDPWRFALSVPNLPDNIKFDNTELSLAFALENNDLFNLVFPLDEIHNGIIPIFKEYAKLRQNISRELPAKISKSVATSELDESTKNKFGPQIAEMNTLLTQGQKSCARAFKEVDEALPLLVLALEKKYGTKMNYEPNESENL